MLSTLFGIFAIAMSAYSEPITPFYNNTYQARTTVSIDSNGKATVNVYYYGRVGVTKSATITTKLQKNVSGVWQDVSIGTANNSWIDTSSSFTATFNHTANLTSRGTYRAISTYQISGTGGATDVIESISEAIY